MAGKYDEAVAGLEAVPFKTAKAYTMGALFGLAQYQAAKGDLGRGTASCATG